MAAAVLPERWQLSTHVNSITSQKTDMAVSIVTVVCFKLKTDIPSCDPNRGTPHIFIGYGELSCSEESSLLCCEVVSLDYSCLIFIRQTVPSSEESEVHKEKVLNPPALEDEGISFLRNFGKKFPVTQTHIPAWLISSNVPRLSSWQPFFLIFLITWQIHTCDIPLKCACMCFSRSAQYFSLSENVQYQTSRK